MAPGGAQTQAQAPDGELEPALGGIRGLGQGHDGIEELLRLTREEQIGGEPMGAPRGLRV